MRINLFLLLIIGISLLSCSSSVKEITRDADNKDIGFYDTFLGADSVLDVEAFEDIIESENPEDVYTDEQGRGDEVFNGDVEYLDMGYEGDTNICSCEGKLCGEYDGCGNRCIGSCPGGERCNPDTYICESGCTDGEKRCNANIIQTCENGQWVNTTDCASQGKSCQNGQCVSSGNCSNVCEGCYSEVKRGCNDCPNDSDCDDPDIDEACATAMALQASYGCWGCASIGYARATDDCNQNVCTDGQTRCNGNVIQNCINGQWVSTTDCSSQGKSCQNGQCVSSGCTDGEKRCSGNVIQTCVNGKWENGTDCSSQGKFCQNGECISEDCQISTTYFWDCASCPGGRELSPTGRVYRFNRWSFAGKEYLIVSNYTSANFYNVTNPLNPLLALEGAAYTPWGIAEGSPDDDTQQWDLALLPEQATGLGMFMNFGWVTFKVNTNAQGALTGFSNPLQRYRITPPNYIPTPLGAKNAALFLAANGKTYAAAAYLAQGQSTGAIDLADMSTPANLQVVSQLPNTSARGLIRVLGSGSTAHLVTSDVLGNSLLIFNVANPSQPGLVAQVAFPGIRDFDLWQNRLYVLYKPSSTVSAAVYDLTNPANPQLFFSTDGLSWQYYNVTGVGDYIFVSNASAASSTLPVMAWDIQHPTTPVTFLLEPPGGSWLYESEQDTAVYDAGSALAFYRAAYARASVTQVPKSCFNKNK